MTVLKIWTVLDGHVSDEGMLEIKPMTNPRYAHLVLKDEDGNEAYVVVDADGLTAILKVLQDQRDEMLPDIDEDLLDIWEDDD